MSENAPFLEKFAKAPAKGKSESNPANPTPEKGTLVTEVERETTDDN